MEAPTQPLYLRLNHQHDSNQYIMLLIVQTLQSQTRLMYAITVEMGNFDLTSSTPNCVLINSSTTVGYLLEVFIRLRIPSLVRISTSA